LPGDQCSGAAEQNVGLRGVRGGNAQNQLEVETMPSFAPNTLAAASRSRQTVVLMMARTHGAPVYTNSGPTALQSRAAFALGVAGLGPRKYKNESEHGRMITKTVQRLLPVSTRSEDVDDCPDIGDQNDEPNRPWYCISCPPLAAQL